MIDLPENLSRLAGDDPSLTVLSLLGGDWPRHLSALESAISRNSNLSQLQLTIDSSLTVPVAKDLLRVIAKSNVNSLSLTKGVGLQNTASVDVLLSSLSRIKELVLVKLSLNDAAMHALALTVSVSSSLQHLVLDGLAALTAAHSEMLTQALQNNLSLEHVELCKAHDSVMNACVKGLTGHVKLERLAIEPRWEPFQLPAPNMGAVARCLATTAVTDFQFSSWAHLSLASVLQDLGSVQTLRLRRCRLLETDLAALNASLKEGNIRNLNLVDVYIGRLPIVSRLVLDNVHSLTLDEMALAESDLAALSRLVQGQTLTKLALTNTTGLDAQMLPYLIPAESNLDELQLSGQDLGKLLDFSFLSRIAALRLDSCGIAPDSLAKMLPWLSSCVELDLSRNPIGDEGMPMLLETITRRPWKRLVLDSIDLTGQGVSLLFSRVVHVEEISLVGNTIGLEGATALARMLPCQSVQKLALSWHSDMYQAMTALQQGFEANQSLIRVDIQGKPPSGDFLLRLEYYQHRNRMLPMMQELTMNGQSTSLWAGLLSHLGRDKKSGVRYACIQTALPKILEQRSLQDSSAVMDLS